LADLTHYDANETFSVTATFTVAGTPTDPTTVAATAYKPDGTTTAYAYPSANISRTSAGVYVVTGTADQAGTWYVEVVGTGTAAGRERQTFVVDPRWPADLLATNALTSIEKVELLLDRVGTQGSRADEEDDDRFIAYLINTFSSAIQNYTQRQFKPVQAAATKVYAYDGSGTLSLAPYEATTLTTVTLFSDLAVADQVVLVAGYSASDHYYAEPRQRTAEGTYLHLTMPTIRSDVSQVTIVGNWGAGLVPADIDYVCAAEAANAYMRATSRAPRGVPAEDFLGPDVGPFSLSRRSMGILDAYANRVLVY
jgi:hypothetical protein